MTNPRHQISVAVVLISCAARICLGEGHDIPEHGLHVDLPDGWNRIEALSGNTILKLARTDGAGKEARIVIFAFAMEKAMTLSDISRDDHIRALQGGSMLGEDVSVIGVGRTKIEGVDALWGKTQRNLPSRGLTYEYTYELFREYKGVPKGFTIRLTSYGDDRWFQATSSTFDRFIQSIQFSARPIAPAPIGIESPPLSESTPTPHETSTGFGPDLRVELKPGDPFWLALLKSYGEVFLMILLASTVIGIGKWL